MNRMYKQNKLLTDSTACPSDPHNLQASHTDQKNPHTNPYFQITKNLNKARIISSSSISSPCPRPPRASPAPSTAAWSPLLAAPKEQYNNRKNYTFLYINRTKLKVEEGELRGSLTVGGGEFVD